jgi:hypothetical protein
MIMKYLPRQYDMIQIQILSHMLLVWALSFVKLLRPKLKFLSCTHDQDTRTPINKTADSYTESCTQHTLLRPPNITPFICGRTAWNSMLPEALVFH